jgi:hypothetical protein
MTSNLQKICDTLEYDLEETRKWAVQCELELVYWKNKKSPPPQEQA